MTSAAKSTRAPSTNGHHQNGTLTGSTSKPAADPPPDSIPTTLRVDQLRPSPTNPRKTFTGLDSLAESIRKVGIRQRLLVRPVPPKGKPVPTHDGDKWVGVDHFEIVCGERRFRASKLVGLTRIPVDVALLSNEQVLLIQLVENDEREDLVPSEQAIAYRRLANVMTVEAIAEKTGRPLSVVRGILKLSRLSVEVLDAVDSGQLPRVVAELVARIPGEESRAKCGQIVLSGQSYYREGDHVKKPKPDDEPLTFRETKKLIATHFQVQLKDAPFDRIALDLVKDAGSCDSCAKRAGNDPDAVADGVRADMCLDPACYRAKSDAHHGKTIEAAKADGKKLLSKSQSAGYFQSWGDHAVGYDSPYIDLDGECYEDQRRRKWRTLLKGHITEADVVIAVDPAGRPREMVDRKRAQAIARKEHRLGRAGGSTSAAEAKRKKEQSEGDRKAKLGKAAAGEAIRLVAKRVTKQFHGLLTLPSLGESVRVLRQLALGLVDNTWNDVCRVVARGRGVAGEPHDAVRAILQDQEDPAGILGVIAELVAARMSSSWSNRWYADHELADEEIQFWKAFGVDREALLAAAEKPLEPSVKLAQGTGRKAGRRGASARTAPSAQRVTEPPVARPGQNMPLVNLPLFPEAAAKYLHTRHNILLVGELVPHIEAARAKSPGTPIYAALRALGLEPPDLHAAGDALVDSFGSAWFETAAPPSEAQS